MTKTLDPALGSYPLTFTVAFTVGVVVALVPFALRERFPGPRVASAGGGLVYALFCLAVWTGVRITTGELPFAPSARPGLFVVLLSVNVVVIGLLVAIPYYLYARWQFVAPLTGAFAASGFVLLTFLTINNGVDFIILVPFPYSPFLIGGISVLAIAEFVVRRVLRALF